MCKKETDHKQHHNQTVCLMDSLSTASSTAASSAPGSALSSLPGSVAGSIDETPRVKFLCSFLGSILPRPLDGKLRYVGGETRIVSLPRDVSYEDLMNRMRELYDGTAVLKYQQVDEDLDALVSVVNDDDVINMMEEYDKMALSDRFTRLRIFLFSHPDQDGSPHFGDGDDGETERRYVDALNTLNDGSDLRRLQQPGSLCINSVDEHHVAEQFFNSFSIEGGIHSQRSSDLSMAQYNMHPLRIPQMGSGQYPQAITQRYTEMDGTWSPGYHSPRHYGHHDPRSLVEYPPSPSSVRYHLPFGELPDKSVDRMPEEYARQQVNHHPAFDHQPQVPENVVWMPAGAISCDKGGFPGNLIHAPGFYEANTVHDHCRLNFPRNQQHMEHPHMGNGPPHAATPCTECLSNREVFMSHFNPKLPHGVFPIDQIDPRSGYNEAYSNERGWIPQHQLNPVTRIEEARTHKSSARRLSDHYVVDNTGTNFHGHGNLMDGHHMPSTYVRPDLFHDQPLSATTLLHIPSEERGARYGNNPHGNATDSLYPMTHGQAHPQPLWRNFPNHVPGAPSYEASGVPLQVNGALRPAFVRGPVENGTRCSIGLDNHYPWVDPSQKILCIDGKSAPEHSYAHSLKLSLNHNQENLGHSTQYPNQSSSEVPNLAPHTEPPQLLDMMPTLVNSKTVAGPIITTCVTESAGIEGNKIPEDCKEENHVQAIEISDLPDMHCPGLPEMELVNSSCLRPVEESVDDVKPLQTDPSLPLKDVKLSAHDLSFLSDVVASVTKAALEGVELVKAKAEEDSDSVKHDSFAKESANNKSELLNAQGEVELDSNNENPDISKIEQTKAEEEAIAKGLQTIKNDDLEEFRILGSGTYGAVYHGKWKGSDVAIKRIKASCFAGRPCERERLIADFWKEALILSSLHHPNVVSFYGIVRDGPDGSLATVTEFMINGSLKQFLQKKDRTIDRRKRLIIAMDAAFGMEYLHGKNIVHFDLKCENLLVNMRDPQRPVCKIGDLGLSKVKQHTLVSGGVRGTLPWMAPELLSGKSNMVTEKIDVYSFGIVMWELLTGEEPYADMHCASIIGGIVNNALRPTIPTWCDPEWKSLMESCWAADPADRHSFSEISQKLRNMAAAINVK